MLCSVVFGCVSLLSRKFLRRIKFPPEGETGCFLLLRNHLKFSELRFLWRESLKSSKFLTYGLVFVNLPFDLGRKRERKQPLDDLSFCYSDQRAVAWLFHSDAVRPVYDEREKFFCFFPIAAGFGGIHLGILRPVECLKTCSY